MSVWYGSIVCVCVLCVYACMYACSVCECVVCMYVACLSVH